MRNYLFLTSATLLVFISFYFITSFYFLSKLSNNYDNQAKSNSRNEFDDDGFQFPDELDSLLPSKFRNKNPKLDLIKSKLVKAFKSCDSNELNFHDVWSESNSWSANSAFVYPQYDSYICKVIKALQFAPIRKSSNARKGTQLKLQLQLEGNQSVYFKPSWYSRNRVIDGPVYSGKDRHNSEIIAFYLGVLLNLRLTPIVVGRHINLKEMWKVGDKQLRDTMFLQKNESRICVYGKCLYCKPEESICANKVHILEGVLLLEIPGRFTKHRSPWQRSYRDDQKAIWQKKGNENYCQSVKLKMDESLLLDLIDASIFDFLIQNGDRHHFETRNGRLMLIDNGKGFGNPHVDFIDILAPVYQCCMLRRTTYDRLLLFTGGELTSTLKSLTSDDLLHPVLTDDHYSALERRLLKLFRVIEFCQEKNGKDIFR